MDINWTDLISMQGGLVAAYFMKILYRIWIRMRDDKIINDPKTKSYEVTKYGPKIERFDRG